jgi:hypothetical protein
MGVELFHDGKFLYCTTKQWDSAVKREAGTYTPLYPLFLEGNQKRQKFLVLQGYFSLALIGILPQIKCLRNQNNLYP